MRLRCNRHATQASFFSCKSSGTVHISFPIQPRRQTKRTRRSRIYKYPRESRNASINIGSAHRPGIERKSRLIFHRNSNQRPCTRSPACRGDMPRGGREVKREGRREGGGGGGGVGEARSLSRFLIDGWKRYSARVYSPRTKRIEARAPVRFIPDRSF